jgi:hypothetical protein
MSLIRKNTGPLGGANVEPALVPESVQRQMEINPFPSGTSLVQPGDPASLAQLPEQPQYTTQDVPLPTEYGSATTSEVVPMMGENVDVAEQAEKFAEPTMMPDFSSPDAAFTTMQQAIQDVGPAYDTYEVKSQRRTLTSEGNEALSLAKHASDFSEPIFEGKGIFGNEALSNLYEESLGITEANKDAIGGAIMLADTSALIRVQQRKYKSQLEDVKSGDVESRTQSYSAEELFGTSTNKTPEERKEIYQEATTAISADPINQPIISSFINDIQEQLGKNFAKPNTPGGTAAPRKVPMEVAQAEFYRLYEDGYIDLGRDKAGRYYPLLTDKSETMLMDTRHAAALYDVELRLMNVNEPNVRSQSNPSVNNALAGKGQQYVSKDGRVIGGKNLVEAAVIFQAGVATRPNPAAVSLLAQMQASSMPIQEGVVALNPARFTYNGSYISDGVANISGVNPAFISNSFTQDQNSFVIPGAFSQSPYAKTMADLSLAKVIEKVKELVADNVPAGKIAETVSKINDSKAQQINKHIKDYLSGNLSKGNRFNVFKISDFTLRMFPMATDINQTNHSGTVRPGSYFGAKYAAVLQGNLVSNLNRVKSMANKVFDTTNKKEINVGVSIQEQLYKLSQEERVLLDAHYQIAKFAEDFGLLRMPNMRPVPQDYIEALTPQVMEQMASYGKTFKSWVEGNLPTKNEQANLPPAFNNELDRFFEKKEWGPRIFNAIMASDMVDAAKKGGGSVTMDAVIETDASQSNAFIIALLIGDVDVANILGGYFGGDEAFAEIRAKYKDLRNLVSSSVNQDIDETMTNPDEAIRKEAIRSLFNKAQSIHGSAFDKMYARGIVVAGLYGKHAEFMFTEVETMLSKFAMSSDIEAVERLYPNRQMFIEDIASIYSTSMSKHLANLQGWQKVTSSIGSIKAAFNGSTKIKGPGNTELDLGTSWATQMEDELNTVRKISGLPEEAMPLSGRASGLAAPGNVGKSREDIQQMKERLQKLNLNIDDVLDQITAYAFPGDKLRKSLPVTVIQSFDAYQMAAAIVYANQGNKSGIPLNVVSIHDATITAPGSTLLLYNAYNNIAPYILANESQPLISGLRTSMEEDYKAADQDVKKAGKANIGTMGKYKAMGGYFDRIYVNSNMIPRNEERGRVDEDPLYGKTLKEYNKKVLDIAIRNGWKPPTERNATARDNLVITPAQFSTLSKLLLTHAGWTTKTDQEVFPELEAIAANYKKETKGFNFNYRSRNQTKAENFNANNKKLLNAMRTNKNQIVNAK